jgi:hypothetical protein
MAAACGNVDDLLENALKIFETRLRFLTCAHTFVDEYFDFQSSFCCVR